MNTKYPGYGKAGKCVMCGGKFIGSVNQKYCSKECMQKWLGRASFTKEIPPATLGAIQEYRVGVELLKKGYEVFKALSPACSCDILALKNGKIIKIEVRTAHQSMDGKIFHSPKNIRAEYIAMALPDKIIYKPDLPE